MVKTLHFSTEIPANRELVLILPRDISTGHAEIVMQVSTEGQASAESTMGSLLRSEFRGIWKDRTDILDSAQFAVELRQRAWDRTGK